MRRLLALIWVLFPLFTTPLEAQTVNLPGLPGLPDTTPKTGQPATKADMDALIRILGNDDTRAELLARLRSAPGPGAATTQNGENFVGRIAEDTRGAAHHILSLLARVGDIGRDTLALLQRATMLDLAMVWWAILDVLMVVVVSTGAYALVRYGTTKLGTRFNSQAVGAGPVRRMVLLGIANLLDALGVAVAWGAGYAVAMGVGDPGRVSFSQTLFLNAFLGVELVKTALRTVLAPVRTTLRLVPLSDRAATYLFFWLGMLVSLIGYGFLFAAPLIEYIGSWAAAQSIRILAMLAMTVIVILIVVRNRAAVQSVLTRRVRNGKSDMVGRIFAYLGSIWHVLTVAYAIAVFMVWLTNPYSALPFMLRATGWSIVAIFTGVAIVAVIGNIISRGIRGPEKVRDRLPLLEARLNAFVPMALRMMRLVVLFCVVLAIAEIWQLISVTKWLTGGGGRQILGDLASLFLVLLIGGLIYLAAASWVEYRLNPNYGTIPTARERTLLVLFRNAFTICLLVIIAMLALSQIGMNIAPLLAGAGVVGLAVGFGAQKLVQDIITGVFIQLDNAMNEGEVVTVAGISGLVERLTIRSVSLRDLSGVLHVIPFSAVDKVANMMRHFSCHLIEIGVAYHEDVAEVKAAIQEAFDRLYKTEHGAFILEPLEMYGLAKFADSAMVVMARFKTLPGKHWNAGRAFNEILKGVFNERGIEIPFPHLTLYMGQNKDGSAPPLHISREERLAALTAAAKPRSRAEATSPGAAELGMAPGSA